MQTFNFLQAPIHRPKDMDLFGEMLRGYTMAKEPGRLQRLEEKENLANIISSAEAKHAPEFFQNRAKTGGYENLLNALKYNILGQTGLRQAEADIAATNRQHTNAGGYKLNPLQKAEFARDEAAAEHGEDDPKTIRANNYLDKVAGNGLTTATKNKLQGAESASYIRRMLADRPLKYTGNKASATWTGDLLKFNTTNDPAIKAQLEKDLINGYLAYKMASEFGTMTVQSQTGTRGTVQERKEAEHSVKLGWPDERAAKVILAGYPKEIIDKANIEHGRILDEIKDINENIDYSAIGRKRKKGSAENNQKKSEAFAEQLKPQNYNKLPEEEKSPESEFIWVRNPKTGEEKAITKQELKRLKEAHEKANALKQGYGKAKGAE